MRTEADDKQQLSNDFILWRLLPTRETERRREQAETRPSMRHNYTCSAKHEAVLWFWASRVGAQTSSFPPLDSSQTLSNRRGFGTRITAGCSKGLRVHLDPCWYFLPCATEIFNTADCPDHSADTLTHHPEARCDGKQEHLARGGSKSKSASLILSAKTLSGPKKKLFT